MLSNAPDRCASRLDQVVVEDVYLGVVVGVVGAAVVVDHRVWPVVLVFGGVRVEDVHGALFLGWRGLGRVLLLLGVILLGSSLCF